MKTKNTVSKRLLNGVLHRFSVEYQNALGYYLSDLTKRILIVTKSLYSCRFADTKKAINVNI